MAHSTSLRVILSERRESKDEEINPGSGKALQANFVDAS